MLLHQDMTEISLSQELTIQFQQTSPPSQMYILASLWAQRYCQTLESLEPLAIGEPVFDQSSPPLVGLAIVSTGQGRTQTIQKLQTRLNYAIANAWMQVEPLISEEMRRHGLNLQLIDPWEMIQDIRQLYQQTLTAYAEAIAPSRLAIVLGTEFGDIRQKYAQIEPRSLGFVTLLFYFTGQYLLSHLILAEKTLFTPYLRVMDDYMYIPLQELYTAAAQNPPHSQNLQAVQHLLPISTRIARSVYEQALCKYPHYQSYSGALNSPKVRASSIRDIEMFQIYLCLCVLEGNLRCIQQELFPLCLVLYPQLKVRWELVQDMLLGIFWEVHHQLSPVDVQVFLPYMRSLIEIFAAIPHP